MQLRPKDLTRLARCPSRAARATVVETGAAGYPVELSHFARPVTLAGNSHCRHVLVQAAWSYQHRPQTSVDLQRRQAGQQLIADVVACMLKIGGFPAGPVELPKEAEVLNEIRLDAAKP